jgi:16S rRNA (guanine1207-N2)-methyltransferase
LARPVSRDPCDLDLQAALGPRLAAPIVVVLGSPRPTADLVATIPTSEITCYQLDLYQAERLGQEFDELGVAARVVAAPDLWDLPADFRTVIFPAQRGAERALKLDMVEQAHHVLRPHGAFAVLSDYADDQLFPTQLKKVFGRVHAPAAGEGHILWSPWRQERPRRRHEVTFQVRNEDGPSLRFLSRPGVFSYGRFDDGARALVEVMCVEPGNRILDLGCGCGTNGVIAGLKAGPTGHVLFVDSNLRAVALAEQNARANGVASFQALARTDLEGFAQASFDVILANPPYYAQHSIAEKFIEGAAPLLRSGGRFYLVTRQPDVLGPMIAEVFGRAEPVERRGYVVLWAEQR